MFEFLALHVEGKMPHFVILRVVKVTSGWAMFLCDFPLRLAVAFENAERFL